MSREQPRSFWDNWGTTIILGAAAGIATAAAISAVRRGDNNTEEVDNTEANRRGMTQQERDNRANQKNPNHTKSGPGRQAGYHGDKDQASLDNHADQMNPNNPKYHKARSNN